MFTFQASVEPLNSSETTRTLIMDGCVAAGYTGRDQASVKEHIEELKKLGVPTPYTIPALYWISPDRLTWQSQIQVVGDQTSPEVEFFIAADSDGTLYVTIASDHTDRELETVSVSKSKQVCDKVLGDKFWCVDDVAEHWNKIEISSRVLHDGNWLAYQVGALERIMHYEDLLLLVKDDDPDINAPGLLSGTLPIIDGETRYTSACEMTMTDPILDRSIVKSYEIVVRADRS
ncbi:MAG: DUF2848 domain-containing protein [Deltaproteobacteria bacterium]|nr:DUF2848 domain-containing protein [Deltaproteobacteria bacterium]NNF46800.1 DUF2848 family protein [Desulfofustis sp.]NNK57495.1 DUF2848 family protein [Desulfofustis sp.]